MLPRSVAIQVLGAGGGGGAQDETTGAVSFQPPQDCSMKLPAMLRWGATAEQRLLLGPPMSSSCTIPRAASGRSSPPKAARRWRSRGHSHSSGRSRCELHTDVECTRQQPVPVPGFQEMQGPSV